MILRIFGSNLSFPFHVLCGAEGFSEFLLTPSLGQIHVSPESEAEFVVFALDANRLKSPWVVMGRIRIFWLKSFSGRVEELEKHFRIKPSKQWLRGYFLSLLLAAK